MFWARNFDFWGFQILKKSRFYGGPQLSIFAKTPYLGPKTPKMDPFFWGGGGGGSKMTFFQKKSKKFFYKKIFKKKFNEKKNLIKNIKFLEKNLIFFAKIYIFKNLKFSDFFKKTRFFEFTPPPQKYHF